MVIRQQHPHFPSSLKIYANHQVFTSHQQISLIHYLWNADSPGQAGLEQHEELRKTQKAIIPGKIKEKFGQYSNSD
jgi:hypothetical protein